MKKSSLKLNELVRSELELTEQAVIRGGFGVSSSLPPSSDDNCYCVIVTYPEGRGSTKNEAYNHKNGGPA
ncbi:hypothetical protein [Phocaeicola sp.]